MKKPRRNAGGRTQKEVCGWKNIERVEEHRRRYAGGRTQEEVRVKRGRRMREREVRVKRGRGKSEREVASIILNQAEVDEVDSVFWRRQSTVVLPLD